MNLWNNSCRRKVPILSCEAGLYPKDGLLQPTYTGAFHPRTQSYQGRRSSFAVVAQALIIAIYMRGVIDKEVDHMEIVFGEIAADGQLQGIAPIGLIEEEFSHFSPGKNQAAAELIDEAEDLLIYAEAAAPQIQVERQLLSQRTY